jgi:hypothetical protein
MPRVGPTFAIPSRCILDPDPDAIVVRHMHNVAPKLGEVGVAHAKHAPKALDPPLTDGI